jgi:hypothetical protein
LVTASRRYPLHIPISARTRARQPSQSIASRTRSSSAPTRLYDIPILPRPPPKAHLKSEDIEGTDFNPYILTQDDLDTENIPTSMSISNIDTYDNQDVMCHPDLFNFICQHFKIHPQIDLFASAQHHQLPCYVSKQPDPKAHHIDAFTLTWSVFETVYINPPWILIPQVLLKLHHEMLHRPYTALLILPHWPNATWWPLWKYLSPSHITLSGRLYLDNNQQLRPPPKWDTVTGIVQPPFMGIPPILRQTAQNAQTTLLNNNTEP